MAEINESSAIAPPLIEKISQIEADQLTIPGYIMRILRTYKKTSITAGVITVISIYVWRKYGNEISMMYSLYRSMTQMSSNQSSTDFSDSVKPQIATKFKCLMPKLLSHINKQIQNVFSILATYEMITKSEEKNESFWVIFKDKIFSSIICSITVSRVLFTLSQTHLVLLEKLASTASGKGYSKQFYDIILNELWTLALKLIEHLCKSFENKLSAKYKEISIRAKISAEELQDHFSRFRLTVESLIVDECNSVQFGFLSIYIKDLASRINDYESQQLSSDKSNYFEINRNVNGYIHFLKMYYDVVTSSFFTSILVKGLDYDYTIFSDIIIKNYEDKEKTVLSMPVIISFLYYVQIQIMSDEDSMFNITKYKELTFEADLNYFQEIIYA